MPGPFDLERFAPNPHFEFILPGAGDPDDRTYRCLADPDVDQVARMLRIEETIRSADTTQNMVAAMVEGKQLLVELIQEAEPGRDLEEFKAGGQQILSIFNGIMHGESVAQAVLEGIHANTPDTGPDPGTDDPDGLQPDDPEAFAANEGDNVPLRPGRPSPEQSSASEEPADTLQAIGMG